jgi:hypothetical protein
MAVAEASRWPPQPLQPASVRPRRLRDAGVLLCEDASP